MCLFTSHKSKIIHNINVLTGGTLEATKQFVVFGELAGELSG